MSSRLYNNQNELDDTSKEDGHGEEDVSDIEGSQVSLPRSYTLPREFKYHNKHNERREGCSRFTGSRFYLPSTNSSDGKFPRKGLSCFFKLTIGCSKLPTIRKYKTRS